MRAQAGDPLTRGWATVFGGTFVRLLLGFVASVAVARALGPAAFGTYAILGVVAAISAVFVDLGLTGAAVRRIAAVWPAEPALARRRAMAFLAIRALIAVALILIAVPLSLWLSPLLPGSPDRQLVFLAFLGVAVTGLSGAVAALLQATGAFANLSLVLIVNSGLTAVLALGLSAAGRLTIASALLILGIATSLVSLALGWWLLPQAWKWPETHQSTWSRASVHRVFGLLRAESRALFAFGGWLWLSNGCAFLAASLDLLLVGHWLPPALVGQYALASNLAGKADIVNQSLYTVLLPAASALHEPRAVREYLRRCLWRSALLSVALLPLFVLAGPLIELFYGTAFAPAAGPFRLLLGIALLDIWVMPLLMLTFTYNRSWLLAAGDALRVVVLLLAGVALIPTLGLGGAALTRLCSRVAGAALVLVGVRRAAREPTRD